MRTKLLPRLLCAAAASAAVAASPAPGDPLVGRWHGWSLCQVKPSACHDEEVVYRIAAKAGGGYAIQASKIVAGAEIDMGTLDAAFAPATGTLVAAIPGGAGRAARWVFRREGDRLSGRLVTNGDTVFRLVEAVREPTPAR